VVSSQEAKQAEGSRESSVGKVSRFPTVTGIFSYPPVSYSRGAGLLSPEIKQPERTTIPFHIVPSKCA